MSASAPPNPLAIQMSVKANAQDLNAYLRDLQSWTSDVKAKDQKLKTGEMTLTKTPLAARPIRGAPAAPVVLPSSATADQQRFAAEKAAGNAAFTRGEFDTAITHYSQCMILMPHDAISASNRSQALLKLRRFHESESDATTAIELDPTHVKSYFRRAQARKELRKYAGAVEDTEKIAQLDKTNKPAQALHKECTEMLKKQQQARAQLSQPIVSAKPVAPLAPRVTPAPQPSASAASTSAAVAAAASSSSAASSSAAAPATGRRMIIQEEDDDDEDDQEEVKINSSSSSAITAAPVAATVSTAKATIPTAATPAAAPAPASAITPSVTASPVSPASSSSSAPPAAAPVSPSSSSSSGLRAPKTAYDFDATFRAIRTDASQIADYFRLMPDASAYGTLLKTALDGNMLKSVINAIVTVLQPAGDYRTILTILSGLSTVPRFSVARMMLDSPDKKSLASVVNALMQSRDAAGASEAQVRQVAKDFAVTLAP